MSNEEMLKKIRLDRPSQVINAVLSFKLNEYGFYDVKVDMESMFFTTKTKHFINILPYPLSEYAKLSKNDKINWQSNNNQNK